MSQPRPVAVTAALMVEPFPQPGPLMTMAYRHLQLAAGTEEQRKTLPGPVKDLPRPWIPATCQTPALRDELWRWLDQVVSWLNTQMCFDPGTMIPPCWPQHAHLVHEIAAIAELRRRAELALTVDPLEEWYRYAYPAFTGRMTAQIKSYCDPNHPATPPTAGRLGRHAATAGARREAYTADRDANLDHPATGGGRTTGPRLALVDEDTGEMLD